MLVRTAEQEVRAVLKALPPAVREPVRQVGIVFERRPSRPRVEEGADPFLLGLFEGNPVASFEVNPEPTRIFLFLENLWEEAGGVLNRYRREVRRTLLHEIGHYLGWDEEDLAVRSMD